MVTSAEGIHIFVNNQGLAVQKKKTGDVDVYKRQVIEVVGKSLDQPGLGEESTSIDQFHPSELLSELII